MTVTHAKVSALPDDPAYDVGADEWNAAHVIDLTTGDIPDTTNLRYVTDAQLVVIGNTSNTNTGDQTLSGLGGIAHSLATAINDFLVASGAGAFVKKTLAEVKTILGLGSAAYTASTDYVLKSGSLTQITTRSHTALSDIGTNAHSVIDTFIASKAAASGLASLSAGSLVVQDPANATATPTISKIVIADAGGKVDGWISAATDALAGKVELATDAETITGTDTARAVTPANARAAYTPLNIAAVPASDHTSVGPKTNAFAAGATITIMDLVILNSSSQWVQTDANALATYAGMLAISLESKTAAQAMSVALPGSFVRDDTWNWTPGAVLYLSETAAQITATQPTTTDAAIRIVGFALTADVIWFQPDGAWITHT